MSIIKKSFVFYFLILILSVGTVLADGEVMTVPPENSVIVTLCSSETATRLVKSSDPIEIMFPAGQNVDHYTAVVQGLQGNSGFTSYSFDIKNDGYCHSSFYLPSGRDSENRVIAGLYSVKLYAWEDNSEAVCFWKDFFVSDDSYYESEEDIVLYTTIESGKTPLGTRFGFAAYAPGAVSLCLTINHSPVQTISGELAIVYDVLKVKDTILSATACYADGHTEEDSLLIYADGASLEVSMATIPEFVTAGEPLSFVIRAATLDNQDFYTNVYYNTWLYDTETGERTDLPSYKRFAEGNGKVPTEEDLVLGNSQEIVIPGEKLISGHSYQLEQYVYAEGYIPSYLVIPFTAVSPGGDIPAYPEISIYPEIYTFSDDEPFPEIRVNNLERENVDSWIVAVYDRGAAETEVPVQQWTSENLSDYSTDSATGETVFTIAGNRLTAGHIYSVEIYENNNTWPTSSKRFLAAENDKSRTFRITANNQSDLLTLNAGERYRVLIEAPGATRIRYMYLNWGSWNEDVPFSGGNYYFTTKDNIGEYVLAAQAAYDDEGREWTTVDSVRVIIEGEGHLNQPVLNIDKEALSYIHGEQVNVTVGKVEHAEVYHLQIARAGEGGWPVYPVLYMEDFSAEALAVNPTVSVSTAGFEPGNYIIWAEASAYRYDDSGSGSENMIAFSILPSSEKTDYTEFLLPAGITVIESQTFAGTEMKIIALPVGCTEIKAYAFNASALKMIFIPDSVTTIDPNAFAGTTDLVIYTSQGSSAWVFAREKGIPCIPFDY